jgi:hypothetical protein
MGDLAHLPSRFRWSRCLGPDFRERVARQARLAEHERAASEARARGCWEPERGVKLRVLRGGRRG